MILGIYEFMQPFVRLSRCIDACMLSEIISNFYSWLRMAGINYICCMYEIMLYIDVPNAMGWLDKNAYIK